MPTAGTAAECAGQCYCYWYLTCLSASPKVMARTVSPMDQLQRRRSHHCSSCEYLPVDGDVQGPPPWFLMFQRLPHAAPECLFWYKLRPLCVSHGMLSICCCCACSIIPAAIAIRKNLGHAENLRDLYFQAYGVVLHNPDPLMGTLCACIFHGTPSQFENPIAWFVQAHPCLKGIAAEELPLLHPEHAF